MTPLERICNTLAEEFGEAPQLYAARAESIEAVRMHYDVALEACLYWIRDRPAGKEHSLAEFRNWCEKFVDLVERVDFLPPPVCPQCFSAVFGRLANGRFWCPQCGEVDDAR
jgi:hypothetical protein